MRALMLSVLLFSLPVATPEWTSTAGRVTIFAEAPFGDIEGVSNQAICMLSGKTLTVNIPVASFIFSKVMMQDHFNARYLESDRYPRAIFKGEISNAVSLSENGTYPVQVSGKLKIHGVKRDRTITGKIEVKDDQLILQSDFEVKSSDHRISVPELVGKQVCQTVQVRIDAELTEKKKAL